MWPTALHPNVLCFLFGRVMGNKMRKPGLNQSVNIVFGAWAGKEQKLQNARRRIVRYFLTEIVG